MNTTAKQPSDISIPSERNIGLDVLKGVAALLVCLLHFLHADFGTVTDYETYIPNLTKVLYGICACSVPLFFMINGTLMVNRSCTNHKLLRKILNFLKIRFVWGAIIGATICIMQSRTLSLGNLRQASFYLWFFEALAVIYLLLMLWYKIRFYKWAVFVPIGLFVFPFLANFIGLCYVAVRGESIGSLGHIGLFRLYGVLYFLLPFYLKRLTIPGIVNAILIISGIALIAFEVFIWSNHQGTVYEGMNACFPTIGALLLTIGMYSTFTSVRYNFQSVIVRYLSWTGRNCMGIYLFHMPIIVLVNQFLRIQHFNILLNIAICLIITAIGARIFERLKQISPIEKILQI